MTQEALTNAGKHGHASRAVVEISEDNDSLRLLVRDNGRGFDPSEKSEGFGLLGMSERVTLLGGELEVESSPGTGTTIRARLPVRRASGEQQMASG
jgi:signal transduction histidine kinase